MNNLIVGVLALVFVQLSGAVFFCKCNEQVVTVSQLKTSADCCAANCQEEPAPVESTDGCPKDSGSPCNEEIELVSWWLPLIRAPFSPNWRKLSCFRRRNPWIHIRRPAQDGSIFIFRSC